MEGGRKEGREGERERGIEVGLEGGRDGGKEGCCLPVMEGRSKGGLEWCSLLAVFSLFVSTSSFSLVLKHATHCRLTHPTKVKSLHTQQCEEVNMITSLVESYPFHLLLDCRPTPHHVHSRWSLWLLETQKEQKV